MSDNFLWVEKYAPKSIDECILPSVLKDEFLRMETIPNALFIGAAGVGKTTVARVLCDTLNIDYMFMNAEEISRWQMSQIKTQRKIENKYDFEITDE